MQLLDEDNLTKFVRSIVISMKPELKSNIDKKDLYRVNEISYMLIQTLSGKESIELIGFNED